MALIIIPYLKEMDSSSLGTKLGLDYDVLSPDRGMTSFLEVLVTLIW